MALSTETMMTSKTTDEWKVDDAVYRHCCILVDTDRLADDLPAYKMGNGLPNYLRQMSTLVSIAFFIVWRVIADRKAKAATDDIKLHQQLQEARIKMLEEALAHSPFIQYPKK